MSGELGVFKPNQSFEEYQERFKDYFTLTRKNGIIEARMSENGKETDWKKEHNYGWGPLLKAIGADPENEVLILGGSGDVWAKPAAMDSEYAKHVLDLQKNDPKAYAQINFDTYQRVSKMIHAIVFDVDIPTIGVVNGPAPGHTELAFMGDIVLSAPNVEYSAIHYPLGIVSGDGFFMMMQYLLGPARANYYCYTGKTFSAKEALDWGMVNELVSSEQIYARAWELAESIMEKPRAVRRLTHEVMRKELRSYIDNNYSYHGMAEAFAGLCT